MTAARVFFVLRSSLSRFSSEIAMMLKLLASKPDSSDVCTNVRWLRSPAARMAVSFRVAVRAARYVLKASTQCRTLVEGSR